MRIGFWMTGIDEKKQIESMNAWQELLQEMGIALLPFNLVREMDNFPVIVLADCRFSMDGLARVPADIKALAERQSKFITNVISPTGDDKYSNWSYLRLMLSQANCFKNDVAEYAVSAVFPRMSDRRRSHNVVLGSVPFFSMIRALVQ